ncbi:MAG: nucleoside transporter C-terminal domain-containing protein [Tepidisphaeraceae bacterium]
MLFATAPVVPAGTFLERGQSLLGLFAFIVISYLIGRVRGAKGIPWRVIIFGTILQFAFGLLVLNTPSILVTVQLAIQKLLEFTNEGSAVIFGNFVKEVPVNDPAGKQIGIANIGFMFGFVVLPTIIFVSMLTAILYHLGILTVIVHGLAWLMRRTMGTSGAETLSTAANIFVGQTEAPLIVRPFLAMATRSELMAIMVGGFSNIATGVLVVYTDLLKDFVENAGGHLALACFISAPATLVVSKLIMPETETPETAGGASFKVERADANVFDAATRGTSEGLALALNVGAMLITFTALIAMLNALSVSTAGMKMEDMLGKVLAPVVWLVGVPWNECQTVGSWLALKTVLNEFFGYFAMSNQLHANPALVSPRTALLATYALCGFANFASIGIQIGGISTLAPTRRADLSRLAFMAMVGGAIATLMGACVVGVLK